MIMIEKVNEINIEFNFNSGVIHSVLHITFNLSNPYVTIIVPGIFGDRGDSRAMFTRIARSLSMKGFSVLRFDFMGGGSNFGFYSENDFELFIQQLDEITSQLLKSFSFIKKVIYIGFSEGVKFAFHVMARREDVIAILSCNGLCVEEAALEKIKRPKIKNGKLVYDSNLGTWLNWSIVERYKEYFLHSCEIKSYVKCYGVYSTEDDFSKKSREFWKKKNWPLKLIAHADHLYTKSKWIDTLIDALVQWHCDNIVDIPIDQNEFFVRIEKNKISMKLVENVHSSDYIIFLHGLFQNKSGPGFLFSQMSQTLYKNYNICMFDFPAAGDSDGKSEDVTYELMQEVLLFIVDYIKKRKEKARIVGIASGSSNYLLFENRDIFDNTVMLFPQTSNLWKKLETNDKIAPMIDTCDIYDKYEWAEQECCILGNVRNRSKGICLSSSLLERLSKFDVLKMLYEYEGIAFVNKKEYCIKENVVFVDDEQGLVMSAMIRDKLIVDLVNMINSIMQ